MNSPEKTFARYLAFDAYKHYVVIGGVNAQLDVVMPPRRIQLAQLEDWLRANLQPTDKVVIEATTNTWTLYDQVIRYASEVVVAHPPHVKLVSGAIVKTDKHDVRRLAKLLAIGMNPQVWLPIACAWCAPALAPANAYTACSTDTIWLPRPAIPSSLRTATGGLPSSPRQLRNYVCAKTWPLLTISTNKSKKSSMRSIVSAPSRPGLSMSPRSAWCNYQASVSSLP